MKRKPKIPLSEDTRQIAIYTRKSRITHKGDSIGVQKKQCEDYAKCQLDLPDNYEYAYYEDKGLSGYFCDRPDFQRLLRDIEAGKIKAIACYKLDRVGRKTADLMRLIEFLERHNVILLVCSNNINTQNSTSKIIIQVLAIIAEFERDTLTERIQDNLMELAKDGRWLGGNTPTGFNSERVSTGTGRNKNAISYLVSIPDEKSVVQKIFRTFRDLRSIQTTAKVISESHTTKQGAKFTASAIRLILSNPIYCTADETAYNYFLDQGGNIFGDLSEFDGEHGISCYNKTDQCKIEDDDSTFFNPKFSQLISRKPIEEWIISVGKHEGFIPSAEWIETQQLLSDIAEKYNRPHRRTNALLAGIIYCPHCGRKLRVTPESNRWTNGKPRFKYTCPGYREKTCNFKAVDGVLLDEYVVKKLSELSETESIYYNAIFNERIERLINNNETEAEYRNTKQAIERIKLAISRQIKNMREAGDSVKKFIQEDIEEMSKELEQKEADLIRIENTRIGNTFMTHELNVIRKKLLSFEEYAKDATPTELVNLITTVVERIYITTENDKRVCHIFVKGCATEDYDSLFGTAEYIPDQDTNTINFSLCNSDECRKGKIIFQYFSFFT